MSTIVRPASRRALACLLLSTTAVSIAAPAQDIASDVPLNDFCVSTPVYTCPTPVIGSRSVTTIVPGMSTPTAEGTLRQGVANVAFDGQLQVGGYATQAVPDYIVPGFDLEFIGQDFTVLAATNIDVAYSLLFPFGSDPRFNASPLDAGTTYTVNALDVSEIGVDIDSAFFRFADGREGDFSLSSVDPTDIVDNGTAVSGTFSSMDGQIVFGVLEGTARVVPTSGPTPVVLFGESVDIVSPLALDFAVTPVELTRLDETGLITPTIAVTDGIEMNGSAITGLAAGVAASDAVNKGQLDAEADARIAADTALATALATETDARLASDAALSTALGNETEARVAGDAALAAALNAETDARTAGDASLAMAIGDEAAARTAGDATIVAALGEEAVVRADADTALATGIAANSASIETVRGVTAAETAARMAADSALAAQLDSFGTRLEAVEGRLDRLDDRIAGSTAVATAMSGNAFLPDMNFNLTANVATYDGAQAGSLQLGALVSRHVALNAGVATGFNKGGKTAGRVGVTLGW